MLENNEVWKDCKGYEGLYQISNEGRVWSVRKQRILSPHKKNNGYLEILLTPVNGKRKYERVHRLVALAFIEQPDGCTVVNHLDGDKTNNRVDNLEWCTVQRNTKHAFDNNLGGFQERQREITEKARASNTKQYQVWKDDKLVGTYFGLKETAKAAGCNEKTVSNCLRANRPTRNGGFRFVCLGGDY